MEFIDYKAYHQKHGYGVYNLTFTIKLNAMFWMENTVLVHALFLKHIFFRHRDQQVHVHECWETNSGNQENLNLELESERLVATRCSDRHYYF